MNRTGRTTKGVVPKQMSARNRRENRTSYTIIWICPKEVPLEPLLCLLVRPQCAWITSGGIYQESMELEENIWKNAPQISAHPLTWLWHLYCIVSCFFMLHLMICGRILLLLLFLQILGSSTCWYQVPCWTKLLFWPLPEATGNSSSSNSSSKCSRI